MANKLISELTTLATVANADELEVQKSGELVTKRATVEAVTKVERDARIAQDNVIEAGIGSNADGTYNTPSGTNHIDSTTSVMNALETLDGIIGASVLLIARVNIDAANLNTAGTVPYEIIAAPGAGKYIDVISSSNSLDFGATPMNWAVGAPKGVLEYDTGSSHIIEWSNTFMESAANAIAKGTWTSQPEIVENKKVQFTFDLGTNPIAGDTRITVVVAYLINDI